MTDDPSGSVSLRAVAQRAGVSLMTVSRVMNQSTHVAIATRERVLEAARVLGYQPDPHVARMMHLVRGRKARRERAVLAVVRETSAPLERGDSAHQYVGLEAIARRAGQHGFRAEEFWLGRDGLDARRLGRILEARGIEGVLVSPQSSGSWASEVDYGPFAAATFGYGMAYPSLHRASTNMMLGIGEATRVLRERGYRRIGMAVTEWVDQRAQHIYSGAMLYFYQGVPEAERLPILWFERQALAEGEVFFRKWMGAYRPEAMITFDSYVPLWLERMGLRIPEDVGLVVHDWAESMRPLAGIDHRREEVAAAAVDLVATQLLHNERGVPEVPRQVLIPPRWVDGKSLRPGREGML